MRSSLARDGKRRSTWAMVSVGHTVQRVAALLLWVTHFGHASVSSSESPSLSSTTQSQIPQRHQNPVRVVILAGQSNMVGHGSLAHLQALIDGNETSCTATTSDTTPCGAIRCDCGNVYRRDLWNGTGYKQRDDVYITYNDLSGPLTVGYAAPQQFGPELGLGWALGDAANAHGKDDTDPQQEFFYFIKAAWGGQDLAVDFRPPSAGEGTYPDVKPSLYGHRYRDMVDSVQAGLERLPSVIPDYNATVGFEVSGFVWFQGWNDVLDATKVAEYASNLAALLRDVTREWKGASSSKPKAATMLAPLPVVIGELGMHGPHYTRGPGADRVQGLRAAQAAVAASPEFDAVFVPTASYAVLNGTQYNGIYHYYGRAVRRYILGP